MPNMHCPRVRPRGDLLFVARFLLSPLGYKPRAAIKSPLDRTNLTLKGQQALFFFAKIKGR